MFAFVRVLFDGKGGSAWNMAVDDALLRCCAEPVVRFYRWAEKAMSIGYFQPHSIVPAGRPFVRRYTGGGLVDHAVGLTYTVVFSSQHDFFQQDILYSYRRLHEAIAKGLVESGMRVNLAQTKVKEPSASCFERPVRFDLLHEGKKVAGAAQRRTKQGCLHQGSLLITGVEYEEQIEILSRHLCNELGTMSSESSLSPKEQETAHRLETTRYSTREWNEWK